MAANLGREVTVLLKSMIVEKTAVDPAVLHCLECEAQLETHQPDAELPDTMLATCEVCKTWYLVDLPESSQAATLVRLPDLKQLRKVLHA